MSEFRPLKRAPFRFSGEAARLGDVLEIQTDEHRYTWQRAPMFWDPDISILFWVDGISARPSARVDPLPRANDVYETWHDRRPSNVLEFELPPKGAWESASRPVRIDYWSDREDPKGLEYTHAIENKARLYRFGSRRKWVYAVKGLQVSDRGLL